MNVFKKCLRKEFGKKGYEKYVKLFSEEIGDKKNVRLNIEDKKIYKDTDVQFELTDDGYYLFDSCVNKYRFEDGKVRIKETDLSQKGQGFGFLPFNKEGEVKNYHFGMETTSYEHI